MSKFMSYFLMATCLVAMWALGYTYYDVLPEQMPSHWNIAGEVDSYAKKDTVLFGVPFFCGLFAILFWFLPKIGNETQKKRYEQFSGAWNAIQVILIAFFTYLYAIMIFTTLEPNLSMIRFMLGGFGGLLLFLGNYMGKVKQNAFVGFKVPWVYGSEENWNKTHRLGGWLMVIVGLLLLTGALTNMYNPYLAFGWMMFAFIVPIIYSYMLSRKQGHSF